MKTPAVRIGNSRGVLLPKTIIVQAGLTDQVKLAVPDGAIVIQNATSDLSGRADAARRMRRRDDDRLVDLPALTQETYLPR